MDYHPDKYDMKKAPASHPYFTKIDIPVRWDALSSKRCKGDFTLGYGGAINYHKPKGLFGAIAPAVLAALRPDTISWVEVSGSVVPHIDTGIVAALNFYKVAGGCDTIFYSINEGTDIQIDDHLNEAKRLNELSITRADSFTASDREIYLLDVSQAHSVVAKGLTREFVQFSWKSRTYQEILATLAKL